MHYSEVSLRLTRVAQIVPLSKAIWVCSILCCFGVRLDSYQEFCCSVAQSCLTLCNTMDCSTPRIRASLPAVFLLELSYSLHADDPFSGLKDRIYIVLFPPYCFSSQQLGSSLKVKPGRKIVIKKCISLYMFWHSSTIKSAFCLVFKVSRHLFFILN